MVSPVLLIKSLPFCVDIFQVKLSETYVVVVVCCSGAFLVAFSPLDLFDLLALEFESVLGELADELLAIRLLVVHLVAHQLSDNVLLLALLELAEGNLGQLAGRRRLEHRDAAATAAATCRASSVDKLVSTDALDARLELVDDHVVVVEEVLGQLVVEKVVDLVHVELLLQQCLYISIEECDMVIKKKHKHRSNKSLNVMSISTHFYAS